MAQNRIIFTKNISVIKNAIQFNEQNRTEQVFEVKLAKWAKGV